MKEFLSSTTGKIIAAAVGILLVIAIILLATSGAGASNTTRGIGLDKSIDVALADAGLHRDQVSGLQGHFDKDDGLDAYEVSFIANNYEYEYTIKASDGAILDCKIESPEGLQVTSEQARDIGTDEALKAALNHAGLKKDDIELTKSRKGSEDGHVVYEFDFLKDNVAYEYDIDAATGGVIEFSREVINKKESTSADGNSSQAGAGTAPAKSEAPKSDTQKTDSAKSDGSKSDAAKSDAAKTDSGKSGTSADSGTKSDYIGTDKAKAIALENVGVKASAATFTAAKLDRDDGRYVYEIDFYTSDREYDYEIDATSGKILERDSEPLDDWDDDDDDDDDDWDDDWDD